jgi:hypothetical protein
LWTRPLSSTTYSLAKLSDAIWAATTKFSSTIL